MVSVVVTVSVLDSAPSVVMTVLDVDVEVLTSTAVPVPEKVTLSVVVVESPTPVNHASSSPVVIEV